MRYSSKSWLKLYFLDTEFTLLSTLDPAIKMDENILDSAFYPVFVDRSKVENKIIEYDLERIKALGLTNPEEIGNSLHNHYIDTSKEIQLSFGKKTEFDFQNISWGFCLSIDENASVTDKLNALFSYYPSHIPRRIDIDEFETIIKKHTDYIDLENYKRKIKLDDLRASFKVYAQKKSRYPATIGIRHMELILEANKLNLHIDAQKLMKLVRSRDKIGRNLYSLIDDDPLLKGQTSLIKNMKL